MSLRWSRSRRSRATRRRWPRVPVSVEELSVAVSPRSRRLIGSAIAPRPCGRPARRSAARLARARRSALPRTERSESAEADQPDNAAQARIAELSRELGALDRDHEAELERQLTELERQRAAAAALETERMQAVELAKSAREAAEASYEQARQAVREAERQVEHARRESARVGGELAAVNQFLRSHQTAPGGASSLADSLTVTSGYELAVAAALDGRLGAAVLDDRGAAGVALLDNAGRDGSRGPRARLISASVPSSEAATVPAVAGAMLLRRAHLRGQSLSGGSDREHPTAQCLGR